MPERRVPHLNAAHTASLKPHNSEQHRPFKFLVPNILVPPRLPIALHCACAEDVDVAPAEDQEGCCILILQVEAVGLPVRQVVGGEGEGALDVEIDGDETGQVER